MNNFNNRIDAQRIILKAVNKVNWKAEELFGLSNKAIDRWILANNIEASSSLANLVRSAGQTLFFLANKSQEQVTEEYAHYSIKIDGITAEIAKEIHNFQQP
ncbi:hypothetical protein IB239_02900 [Pseudomonas sp. PDM12]|uniref:hypothetical protein n=1 Tax=Pseudomonas sp. PDM12 TaxID=2769260 RepID=UPI00177B46F7|nr:hypothetical protein [Pseudomonas sp. PDM12]MBD9653758.1 hypothetical protein [Pseudomonas sp. PDM12]